MSSPATRLVRSEFAARAVVLTELRKLEDWRKRSVHNGETRDEADQAVSRFLRALGHGAVADQWERVR